MDLFYSCCFCKYADVGCSFDNEVFCRLQSCSVPFDSYCGAYINFNDSDLLFIDEGGHHFNG